MDFHRLACGPLADCTTASILLTDLPPAFHAYLFGTTTSLRYIESDDAALGDVLARIRLALTKLGGRAFVKLGNKSPKDAAWIGTNKSLEVREPNDVLLLLKASDIIARTSQSVESLELRLTCWLDALHPSGEFRCVVRDGQLVGVSQRHTNMHFPFLADERPRLLQHIEAFVKHQLVPRGCCDKGTFLVDIYYDFSDSTILVLDVESWQAEAIGAHDRLLLLTSDQLVTMSSSSPSSSSSSSSSSFVPFVIVLSGEDVQPTLDVGMALPFDLKHWSHLSSSALDHMRTLLQHSGNAQTSDISSLDSDEDSYDNGNDNVDIEHGPSKVNMLPT